MEFEEEAYCGLKAIYLNDYNMCLIITVTIRWKQNLWCPSAIHHKTPLFRLYINDLQYVANGIEIYWWY